jgi:hypothetical protein
MKYRAVCSCGWLSGKVEDLGFLNPPGWYWEKPGVVCPKCGNTTRSESSVMVFGNSQKVPKKGIPPGHRSVRKPGQNQGRTPNEKLGLPVVAKRSVSIPAELDEWVLLQQRTGELFSHTVVRLLERARNSEP